MKKRVIYLILFMLLIFPSVTYANEKKEVEFKSCIDGDTARFIMDKEEIKVRFLAIDTPETNHPKKGEEPYGKEAKEYTCNRITNASKIELEFDDNSDKKDKYNRVLAWVWVDDTLLQDELVKNGYAEVAYLYGDYKYTNTLKDHQAVAEASKIGIWNEEARKEFDSNSSSKNDDNTTDNSDSYIDLKNMSTSDIIIVIGVVIIGIVLGPTIKKIKRKIKKYTK